MTTTLDYADLLLVPWRSAGRDPRPDGGLDCWGLVVEVRRRLGLATLDPFAATGPEEAELLSEVVLETFAATWLACSVDQAQTGDVAVFRGFGGHLTHAGVIVPGGNLLHTGRQTGPMCVPWSRLRSRAKGLYRSRP